MFSLEGKVAVVTGGAMGVGKAVAERLASNGARVVVADIVDASDVAASLGGEFVRADVSDEAQVKRLMDAAAELNGHIDACVNNAGILLEAPLTETTAEMIERQFRVNALGVFFGMKHAIGHMRPGGSIVNTASVAGAMAFPDYVGYCASKAACVSMTKVAALEFGPLGVRVNCVSPISIDTPMLAAQEGRDAEIAVLSCASALGRILQPEEVAAVVHFLVADDCPMITGHDLAVDAGCSTGFSKAFVEAAARA